MSKPTSISPNAELLLTSAGPTTDPMQERLLEMATGVKPTSQLHTLRILRIADGWQSFRKADGVSIGGRLESDVEAMTSRLWSRRYIGYVLGNATVTTGKLGNLGTENVETLLQKHDLLLVPGGNTWQTMRGLNPHAEAIRETVNNGMPYIGESAGAIVAGLTTSSALLPPADAAPTDVSQITQGLGLVDFDIVVHAAGQERAFDIPGIFSNISSRVLASYETPLEEVDKYIVDSSSHVEAINNTQAISVSRGIVTRL